MNSLVKAVLFGLALLVGAAVVADAHFARINGISVAPALLPFVGIDSNFPALKRVTNTLEVRTADDSAYATMTVAGVSFTTTIQRSGVMLVSATAPTISSGFGTSPSVSANNGTAAFRVNVGTGGTASSGVIGLPTASTGWNCTCADITSQSSTVYLCKQTAGATTTATIGNFDAAGAAAAWVASDILAVSCFAY